MKSYALLSAFAAIVTLSGCATSEPFNADSTALGGDRFSVHCDAPLGTPDSKLTDAFLEKAGKVAAKNGYRGCNVLSRRISKGTVKETGETVRTIDGTIKCYH